MYIQILIRSRFWHTCTSRNMRTSLMLRLYNNELSSTYTYERKLCEKNQEATSKIETYAPPSAPLYMYFAQSEAIHTPMVP